MLIDEMTETQQAEGKATSGGARAARGILMGLLLAAASPLAVLAPKRFARWFARWQVAVPVWLVLLLGCYVTYEVFLSGWEIGFYPLILVEMLPYLVVLGLLWLLAAYMVRPIGSTWDETPRRSFWKSAALLLAFVLPLPLVLYYVDRLVRWWLCGLQDDWDGASGRWRLYSVVSAAVMLMVFWLEMVQMVRGLASLNRAGVPSLAPICRDCGYSLEGVTDLYEAGRPRDEADPSIPRVCPECGCQITASLDATRRPGTAWTRGQSRSIGAWLGTAGQVVWLPGRFFSRLPLHSSRKAALWFWLGSILMTFVLVVVVFAVEHVLCANREITPLLQPSSMTYWQGRDTDPQSMVPLRPQRSALLWLGDGGNKAGGITLTIVGVAMLVVMRTTNHFGRLMSRDRGMNMHPAGLLVAAYLSPAVLVTGVVVLAAGAWSRPLLAGWLARAPVLVRTYIDEPETLAMTVWLAGTAFALVWCYRVANRVLRGIRYANQ